jgi:hypothetical protein
LQSPIRRINDAESTVGARHPVAVLTAYSQLSDGIVLDRAENRAGVELFSVINAVCHSGVKRANRARSSHAADSTVHGTFFGAMIRRINLT